jgi:hypothetical protein
VEQQQKAGAWSQLKMRGPDGVCWQQGRSIDSNLPCLWATFCFSPKNICFGFEFRLYITSITSRWCKDTSVVQTPNSCLSKNLVSINKINKIHSVRSEHQDLIGGSLFLDFVRSFFKACELIRQTVQVRTYIHTVDETASGEYIVPASCLRKPSISPLRSGLSVCMLLV